MARLVQLLEMPAHAEHEVGLPDGDPVFQDAPEAVQDAAEPEAVQRIELGVRQRRRALV